jgi:hypothetical protein
VQTGNEAELPQKLKLGVPGRVKSMQCSYAQLAQAIHGERIRAGSRQRPEWEFLQDHHRRTWPTLIVHPCLLAMRFAPRLARAVVSQRGTSVGRKPRDVRPATSQRMKQWLATVCG